MGHFGVAVLNSGGGFWDWEGGWGCVGRGGVLEGELGISGVIGRWEGDGECWGLGGRF